MGIITESQLTSSAEWIDGPTIGEPGGFGKVYEVKKRIGGKTISGKYVKKVLHKVDSNSESRFIKEVRFLSKLSHPRIVTIESYSIISKPYFYIMPRYKGSLRQFLSAVSSDYDRIRVVFNNIMEGVEYLHKEGCYHRDLKPENVLMNSDTDLVLADFGLGLDTNLEGTRLTMTRTGMGTRYYSSPEQLEDAKNVDQRTDIYSIGKMVYEAFTGDRPALLDLDSLPTAIQFVVDKATRDRKDERFKTVSELKQSFNMVMNLLIGNAKAESLESILADSLKLDDFDEIIYEDEEINEKIDKLARAVTNIHDKDKIHEIIMGISSLSLKKLLDRDFRVAKGLIRQFIQGVAEQSWPFSYTDEIADKSKILFSNVEDVDIRTEIVYGLLELGCSHTRYHVMNVFLNLLESIKNEREALSMYLVLKEHPRMIDKVKNTLQYSASNLNPLLKQLFVKK